MGNALITRRGGGKSEGLYAWRKYSTLDVFLEKYISTTEQKNNIFPYSPSNVLYKSSSYTFDKNTGIYTLVNPTSVSGSILQDAVHMYNGEYFMLNANSGATMYKAPTVASQESGVTASNSAYNGFSIQTYGNYGRAPYYIYSNKSTTERTFITYVVSGDEFAYPDGGEKGGYWYEKISNLKFTFGTFTPTSNQKETTIVHGLNAKIRFFGIYTEHIKPTENNLYQVEALSLHRGITYASNGTSTENYNGRVSTTYVLTSGPYWYDQGFKISSLYGIGDVTESSITIFKNNHATNDTSSGSTDAPYFIGGRVHKWIAIADWEV